VSSLWCRARQGHARLRSPGWLGSAAFTLVRRSSRSTRGDDAPSRSPTGVGDGAHARLVGSAIAATGGQLRWFWLFILGMAVFGCGQAATLQARYVAADLALAEDRAKAIERSSGSARWVRCSDRVDALEKESAPVRLDEFIGRTLRRLLFAWSSGLLAPAPSRPADRDRRTDPDAERTRPIRQVRRSYGVIRDSLVRCSAGRDGRLPGRDGRCDDDAAAHEGPRHTDLSAYVIACTSSACSAWRRSSAGSWRASERSAGSSSARSCSCRHRRGGRRRLRAVADLPRALPARLGWSLALIGGTTLLTASVPAEARWRRRHGRSDAQRVRCRGGVRLGLREAAAGFHILADVATGVAAGLLVFGGSPMPPGEAGIVAAA